MAFRVLAGAGGGYYELYVKARPLSLAVDCPGGLSISSSMQQWQSQWPQQRQWRYESLTVVEFVPL